MLVSKFMLGGWKWKFYRRYHDFTRGHRVYVNSKHSRRPPTIKGVYPTMIRKLLLWCNEVKFWKSVVKRQRVGLPLGKLKSPVCETENISECEQLSKLQDFFYLSPVIVLSRESLSPRKHEWTEVKGNLSVHHGEPDGMLAYRRVAMSATFPSTLWLSWTGKEKILGISPALSHTLQVSTGTAMETSLAEVSGTVMGKKRGLPEIEKSFLCLNNGS